MHNSKSSTIPNNKSMLKYKMGKNILNNELIQINKKDFTKQ